MKFFDGRVSLLRWAVSADMAHGTHPNFPEKHEEHHRPELQKGLVIKHNANQRYATSTVTAFLFMEVAAIHGIPTQVRSSERLIDSDTEIEERERERERERDIESGRMQDFVVRNDMGCGSTIGPILASGVGIRTVDCGIPQLSMHRCRFAHPSFLFAPESTL